MKQPMRVVENFEVVDTPTSGALSQGFKRLLLSCGHLAIRQLAQRIPNRCRCSQCPPVPDDQPCERA